MSGYFGFRLTGVRGKYPGIWYPYLLESGQANIWSYGCTTDVRVDNYPVVRYLYNWCPGRQISSLTVPVQLVSGYPAIRYLTGVWKANIQPYSICRGGSRVGKYPAVWLYNWCPGRQMYSYNVSNCCSGRQISSYSLSNWCLGRQISSRSVSNWCLGRQISSHTVSNWCLGRQISSRTVSVQLVPWYLNIRATGKSLQLVSGQPRIRASDIGNWCSGSYLPLALKLSYS